MIKKGDLILISTHDHSYERANVFYTQVVYNPLYDSYSDYGGMEHLTEE